MAQEYIDRTCPVCGVVYRANVGRLAFGRQTTCSRACSYKLRTGERTARVALVCPVCGKSFTKARSHAAKARHASFCSRACHYAGRSSGATRRVVTKPYTYTPEGKAAMIASASRPKGKRVIRLLTCLNCGKEFDDPSDGRKRKSGMTFCSLMCCNAYRKGENNPAWRGGHPRYYGPDWRPLQRAARKRDNYTCRRCGVRQSPGRAHDVHHIKPVSSFAAVNDANTLDNVITLCHPCHQWCEWNGLDFTP